MAAASAHSSPSTRTMSRGQGPDAPARGEDGRIESASAVQHLDQAAAFAQTGHHLILAPRATAAVPDHVGARLGNGEQEVGDTILICPQPS